ncbi:hypothetical protein L7F22_068312 [Adiantum nelumboides]|nr:hypothetical protein [Adiantum nelumboides]
MATLTFGGSFPDDDPSCAMVFPFFTMMAGLLVVLHGGMEKLSNTKEAAPPGDCGNLHAIANCLALLIGLGVLSSPYAVASGGLVSLFLNGLVAAAYFYTALLLVWCLEVDLTLTNFSDISRKALGRKGYRVATALLFTDLLSALVGYGISLSDNLVSAIPVGGHSEILGLKRRYFLTLPSYCYPLSDTFAALGRHFNCLWYLLVHLWCQHHSTKCSSMVNKATFPKVLASSFIIAGTFYGGIGFLGQHHHFDDEVLLRPVAVELEAMLPWHADCTTHVLISMGICTMLVIVLIVVSLCLPFFAYVISLVGSLLTVTLCVILPCWMYWSLFRRSIKAWEVALLLLVSVGGVGAGITGTVISIAGIFMVEHCPKLMLQLMPALGFEGVLLRLFKLHQWDLKPFIIGLGFAVSAYFTSGLALSFAGSSGCEDGGTKGGKEGACGDLGTSGAFGDGGVFGDEGGGTGVFGDEDGAGGTDFGEGGRGSACMFSNSSSSSCLGLFGLPSLGSKIGSSAFLLSASLIFSWANWDAHCSSMYFSLSIFLDIQLFLRNLQSPFPWFEQFELLQLPHGLSSQLQVVSSLLGKLVDDRELIFDESP